MANDDEYTKKYMGGDEARFVDKVRMPTWMNALLLAGGVAGVVAGVVSGAPLLGPVLVIGATGVAWTLLSTLRVVVAKDRVHIQFGLFGPEIPLDEIESVEVVDYSFAKYGGWGIRFGLDGSRAFSLPGRGGKAVRIRRRRKRGIETIDITSEQPAALCAAIEQARHGDLAALREQHGVAAAPSRTALDEVEAAHEAEHEEER